MLKRSPECIISIENYHSSEMGGPKLLVASSHSTYRLPLLQSWIRHWTVVSYEQFSYLSARNIIRRIL